MTAAMARFTEVVAAAVPRHQGVLPIEQGEGDSFVAAFALATDALASALELQLEWGRDSWPFRVRLALHTGERPAPRRRQVRGQHDHPVSATASHRPRWSDAARRRGPAISSSITCRRAAWLDDMGVHYLKDIERPDDVHLLRHADLPPVDTPLLSDDAALGNLPVQLTSFMGRDREIDAVLTLMRTNRMRR